MKIYLILILGIMVSTSACIFEKPDFSEVPEVAFEFIGQKPQTELNALRDSILIRIHYQDGNGDLGLTQSDTLSPFQQFNEDGSQNYFYYNYHCRLFRKAGENYVPYVFPVGVGEFPISGRFQPLRTDDKEGPVDGFIDYTIGIPREALDYTIRLEIEIVDKKQNISNTVTTSDYLVESL